MHRRRRDALGRFLPENLFIELPFDPVDNEPEENPFALLFQQPNMANNPPPAFEFPIVPQGDTDNLKRIPSSLLPKFYGLVTEDPKTFLFEFDVLCRSYDYNTDAHKLKLFPSTLKEGALRWFMSLGRGVVNSWKVMQTTFLDKYKEYCKSASKSDNIF